MSSPPVILNVDDHEPSRYAKQKLLQLHGFTVVNARTGQQALDLHRQHHPDAVLLDVGLPDMSGLEVGRRIKTLAQPTIVIHLTATYRGEGDRYHGLMYGGADAYLFEPVEPEALIGTIRRLLENRPAADTPRN